MTRATIRLAKEDDIPTLYGLDTQAQSEVERQALINDAISQDRCWIVVDGELIVGYGIVSHHFYGRSFLDMIYLDRAHRSKGYGPQLLSFLEGQSKSTDLFTSTNESNTHMQHVLEKLGYERSGVIHNLDPGDPEIIYVKKPVAT